MEALKFGGGVDAGHPTLTAQQMGLKDGAPARVFAKMEFRETEQMSFCRMPDENVS